MKYLCTINGHHYFRTRIPQDLQPIFNCREVKKSLKTTDSKDAKLLLKSSKYEFDRIVTLIRSGMMTDEQISELVREYMDSCLQNMATLRRMRTNRQPLTVEMRDAEKRDFDVNIEFFKERLALSDASLMETSVDTFLREKDITLNKRTAPYKKLCIEFLKAQIEIYNVELERMHGNYNNKYDSFLDSVIKQKSSGKLLSKVIAEYIKEKTTKGEWNAKNADATTHFYKQAVTILRDKPITSYTRDDFIKFTDILKKLPKNLNKLRDLRDCPIYC